MQRTTYYCTEWMDEIPGVAGTLPEVAGQLAEGVHHFDDEWIVKPQPIPSTHAALSITYKYVAVPRVDGAYVVPENLPGQLHAIAFALGSGWSPDMLVSTKEEAADDLNLNGTDDFEYLVCIVRQIDGMIHLQPGPKAIFEPAQTHGAA